MIPDVDRERLEHLFRAHPFRFATSMPTIPHEYTLRKTWANQDDFDWAVETIRQYGYRRRWGTRTFTYLDLDGWKYWTMGSPIPQTILINRARL